MDRFRWSNKVDNIRWTTNEENQNNWDLCKSKFIVSHKQNDIDYLNDWLS
ncbi:MAG: hypothetical protein Ta2E_11510 [Mycoplasmoidaceae bacterium]|nr:MAG: hypothetical protein Ta2E_11510 [Mycoplasmoidaceae bacterium]